MLEFSKEFFEREERDGFVIEPMMKSAWAANLEVLHKVDRICKEHDIRYFADWGTLLGAVRHHGYIPWDDDIDICMLRNDYKNFCKVIEEYRDEVALLNIKSVEDWGEKVDKVINIAAFTTNRQEIKEYHGFPFTAGIDIFVVDYVPRSKKEENAWLTIMRYISVVGHIREEMADSVPEGEEYKKLKRNEKEIVALIQEMTNVKFSQPNPSTQELLLLKNRICSLYKDEDADFLTQADCLGQGRDYYLPREVYADVIWMPFENTMVPVPAGYEFLLHKKYGDDYMMPRNVGAGHDYPFYNTAIREVATVRGVEEEEIRQLAIKIGPQYYSKFIHKTTQTSVSFPAPFFEEEEIDGIIVGEERKRIWAAQLEVYLEVKRLCDENNLKLYVIGDTLQGAIKRNGYLPHSEDFHLAMMRQDYMKLLPILQEELDPWFDYRNVYSHDGHEDMCCYVITDSYLCDEDEYKKRFHGCPHIVGVDIASIDGISEEPAKEELRKNLIQNLLKTAESMPFNPPYTQEVINIIKEWKELTAIEVDVNNNLRREFVKAADVVAGAYRGECENVRISADLQEGKDTVYKKKWFYDTMTIKFEGIEIQVPVGYTEIGENEC